MHSRARGPTRCWALSTIAFLILGGACCDAPGPAEPAPLFRTGSIQISVSMTGEDLQEAFTASVFSESVSRSTAGSASESVIVDSLPPGSYELFLNVALNCAVNGDNPVSITVVAGETTTVVVPVTCVLATGTLHVTTVTTGVDLDRDGYRLRIDGYSAALTPVQQISLISANETTTLLRVPVIGSTRLTLYGLAMNCDPADSASRPVQISPGDTAAFTFAVVCRPDTDSVAYVDSAAGGRRVVIVGANGGRPRRLTNDASSGDPAWSPDGRSIAFTTDRDGNRDIYVIDADGSNLRRLTDDAAADYSPAWSPDGERIAFVSERDGTPAIYTLHVDGTGLVRLTTGSAIEAYPAWAPDGRIAFASDRNAASAGNTDVYVVNTDGSNLVRLTTNGGTQPAWSRDGRLAYVAPDCTDSYCQPYIFVRSDNGRDVPLAVAVGDHPSWSPDGRKIAYTAFACDYWDATCVPAEVGLARVDGTDVISLASGTRPAWRP